MATAKPNAAKKPTTSAADGMVMMRCPAGGSGCSFDGVNYDADEEGLVMVPQEAVATLQDHGLKVEAE